MARKDEKVLRESTSYIPGRCEICNKKLAVVIENKKYYCGVCYCLEKRISLPST